MDNVLAAARSGADDLIVKGDLRVGEFLSWVQKVLKRAPEPRPPVPVSKNEPPPDHPGPAAPPHKPPPAEAKP